MWSSKLRLAGLAVMLLITAMRTEVQVRMAHMPSCRPGAVQTLLQLWPLAPVCHTQPYSIRRTASWDAEALFAPCTCNHLPLLADIQNL